MKTESQRDHDRLLNNLKMIERGRSSRKMAAVLGTTSPTYCRKRKTPELLTYIEIRALCRDSRIAVSDFVDGELKLKGE